MAQYGFGSGSLLAVRTDIVTPTPIQFAALQNATVDISFNLKELYGQFQFPLTVARSTAKITGKAKAAILRGRLFNDLFFGQTLAVGQQLTALNEAQAVPNSGPFTVNAANASGFVADLGVAYAATGVPLVRVASAPSTGQYTVAAGIYTFSAGDANAAVQLSYTYAQPASGQKIAIANQPLGAAPVFQMNLTETYQGKSLNLQLNACVSNKLSLPTKIEDFVIPEMDFVAFADASGNVGTISMTELS
jgi:hypothetical protein